MGLAIVLIWVLGSMICAGLLYYYDMKESGSTYYDLDDFFPIAFISIAWPLILIFGLLVSPIVIPYFVVKQIIKEQNKKES